MITPRSDYDRFVKGLNFGHHAKTMTESQLVMHLSMDARVMKPSEAKQTISALIHDGFIEERNGVIDIGPLWDTSKNLYAVKGKSGKSLKMKPGTTGARTVKYVAPGHTRINYAHRVLDIRFEESEKRYRYRQHLRRVKAAKNRKPADTTIYVDRDENGQMSYVSKRGAKVNARSKADKGRKAIVSHNLKKDRYTIEDMRALLRDDHWEEVCGNRTWNYDPKATVHEFNKYLKARKG